MQLESAKQKEVLMYYDGPVLSIWEANSGQKLLAMWIGDNDDEYINSGTNVMARKYAAVIVTDEEWQAYMSGSRDLRSLFENKSYYVSDKASETEEKMVDFKEGFKFEAGLRPVVVITAFALEKGEGTWPSDWLPGIGAFHYTYENKYKNKGQD